MSYNKNTAERLIWVPEKLDVNVSIKAVSTLENYLMRRPKDPLQTLKQTGVVYAIPCKDCDVEYIWETGRALETQKNEHRHYYRCVYDMQKRNNSAASKSCTGGGQKKVAIHENMIILV